MDDKKMNSAKKRLKSLLEKADKTVRTIPGRQYLTAGHANLKGFTTKPI